ncbi:MaoC/PaaZ C-terminal domain-containing protein [Micromonospora sp. DR5-3]|uniref:MaoC/PaaZ C-terminal domain-containing protein n=1 Tax=unclassified Micromonospora TaxID=2617518 RepID=UPI0011D75AD6|nr:MULTISPECIES: MaoC/PaaZ C-terminal domain-containing protein [unclassified Micromonospora]MCW3817935.1 MaoC/PaaZ C-terminal domain-containing protein [Micromonospora sp. DR5-3]TYC21391.1 acyl dehydratase [Micromonospora sp. MP36]
MSLSVGTTFAPVEFEVTRQALVRYAGASGDFNQIHYNDTAAMAAGLPGVIAHGMLTLALANQALCRWLGSATAVIELTNRFTSMVTVPGAGSATVTVTGAVTRSADDEAEIELSVTAGGREVLGASVARVRYPAP